MAIVSTVFLLRQPAQHEVGTRGYDRQHHRRRREPPLSLLSSKVLAHTRAQFLRDTRFHGGRSSSQDARMLGVRGGVSKANSPIAPPTTSCRAACRVAPPLSACWHRTIGRSSSRSG